MLQQARKHKVAAGSGCAALVISVYVLLKWDWQLAPLLLTHGQVFSRAAPLGD